MLEKHFDFKTSETHWNDAWDESGVFTPEQPSQKEPFVIILPPPNVTGVLTVGHILGNTSQDALIRWKKMMGFNALWLPGTDHAGIATQKVVEDALLKQGKRRDQMTREEFLDHCWEWKEKTRERIITQIKRLGCALDWSRECFTLDEQRSHAVRTVFVHLYEKGLIYRGDYTVNWCPSCETAISDEEVEYVEKSSFLYWIRYPLEEGGHITVATTRPETMLGDTAVAVSSRDEGKAHFIGKCAILPFLSRKLPIIADEAVDPEFGSGFVKVTPAHDPNDFMIGQRHGLPFVVVIDRKGHMTEAAGETFAGLERFECREKVLDGLKTADLLEKVEPYTHAVGIHDRCKTVIEPLLSKEWFVKMESLAAPAIECVEKNEVSFYPPRWRNVYLSWMNDIRDWCISRRLWWGHRIPVWYCPDGHMTVSVEDPSICAECAKTTLEQDDNVLDTWFSSWLWTFSPMGWPEETQDLDAFHPTSVLVTGADIIFFWVARMIMASLEFMKEIPFRDVFLTGIVRDTEGRKMSKSLGNSPDPLTIIDRYGADAFRFTMLMLSPPGHDIYFAEEKVEVGRNFINKIWQASRMVLSAHEQDEESIFGEIPGESGGFAERWKENHTTGLGFVPELEWEDRWILDALERCIGDLTHKFSSWRINDAAGRLYDFFWHDYCDWYLELAKIRLYGEGDRKTVQSTLLFVLGESLKLLHPFIPYVTEELWSKLPMTGGLLLEHQYPRLHEEYRDREVEAEMSIFQGLVTAVRNIRAQYRVNPSTRIDVSVRIPNGAENLMVRMRDGLMQLTGAAAIEYGEKVTKEKGCASSPVGEYEVVIPLGGLADIEAELKRLTKEKEKLESVLAAVERKLSKKEFLEKAKEEIVQKEKDKQALLRVELEKIRESLEIIQDM